MAELFMGTDPGKTGATAIINREGEVCEICPHRAGLVSLIMFYDWVESQGMIVKAALEKVHASPQMGVKSAFTFGGYYYQALTLYEVYDIDYEEVTPQFWQKELDCLTGGDKKISQAKVKELFDIKVSQEQADGVLIAEWCKRQYT